MGASAAGRTGASVTGVGVRSAAGGPVGSMARGGSVAVGTCAFVLCGARVPDQSVDQPIFN